MLQLYRYDNCFIGHKVGSFSLIGSLLELENLRKSIKSLYTWRKFAIDIGNILALTHINESYRFDLIELSDNVSSDPVRVSKRVVDHVNVHLSPSNQSKRMKPSMYGH